MVRTLDALVLADILKQEPFDVPELLWHYTNADGLQGILSHHELWASHVSGLNDLGEVEHGKNVLVQAWEDLKKKLRDLPDDVEDCMDGSMEALAHSTSDRDVYLLSASNGDDLLNQWQHYGRRGYCIGVPTSQTLMVSAKKNGSHYPFVEKWYPVSYDPVGNSPRAQDRLLALIWSVRTGYHDPGKHLVPETDDVEYSLADEIGPALDRIVPFFKHPAFRAEREYRMVFQDTRDHVLATPRVRVAAGRLTPYLTVTSDPDEGAIPRPPGAQRPRLPIREVRCGPDHKELWEANKRRLATALDFLGYTPQIRGIRLSPGGVRVGHSAIPYLGE